MQNIAEITSSPGLPTAGQSAWIISDGKAGHAAITAGVAQALGLDYRIIEVKPKGLHRLLSPWMPVNRAERPGGAQSLFQPPWPAFVFAAGRLTAPYLKAVRRAAGRRSFAVCCMDPHTGLDAADLIWAPEHDRLRGPNVITTLTSPHGFSPERLSALRAAPPPEIAALPHPRFAILLGGPNGSYRFGGAARRKFADALSRLARRGASFLITPSRRTTPELLAAAEEATRGRPRILWNGQGANPYPDILANAGVFIITADSVNMTGEACATGHPIHIFDPGGGAAKFRRFHAALQAYGATRPLSGDCLDHWTYEPLDAAKIIAREITRRWQARQNKA